MKLLTGDVRCNDCGARLRTEIVYSGVMQKYEYELQSVCSCCGRCVTIAYLDSDRVEITNNFKRDKESVREYIKKRLSEMDDNGFIEIWNYFFRQEILEEIPYNLKWQSKKDELCAWVNSLYEESMIAFCIDFALDYEPQGPLAIIDDNFVYAQNEYCDIANKRGYQLGQFLTQEFMVIRTDYHVNAITRAEANERIELIADKILDNFAEEDGGVFKYINYSEHDYLICVLKEMRIISEYRVRDGECFVYFEE